MNEQCEYEGNSSLPSHLSDVNGITGFRSHVKIFLCIPKVFVQIPNVEQFSTAWTFAEQFDDKTEFFTSLPHQSEHSCTEKGYSYNFNGYVKFKMRRFSDQVNLIYILHLQKMLCVPALGSAWDRPRSKDNKNNGIIWKMFEFDVMFEEVLASYQCRTACFAVTHNILRLLEQQRMPAKNHWTFCTHMRRQTEHPTRHVATQKNHLWTKIMWVYLPSNIFPVNSVVGKGKQLSTAVRSTFSSFLL